MHILIVDDEPLARQRLRRILEGDTQLNVVAEADSGASALAAIEEHDPDLVLLDLHMPDGNGLTVANRLIDGDEPPLVIVTTAHEDHALEAFKAQVFDYLLKPVSRQGLLGTIDRARRLNRAQQTQGNETASDDHSGRSHFKVRERHGLRLVAIEDVCCLLAEQKYVNLVYREGESLIDEPLKQLEEEFGDRFIRVHRNALVAVAKIVGIERLDNGQTCLRLKDTDHKPLVSRRHIAEVKNQLGRI